jgi:hypothetical protein
MKFSHILVISVLFFSCHRGDDCFSNKGSDVTISRDVEIFDKISVENRINLVITQDTIRAGHIEISGPENLLQEITTEVVDGFLSIRNTNTCNFVRSYDYQLTVKVFLKDLKTLSVDGIASVSSADTLFVTSLDITHLALSDVSLTLKGSDVFLRSRNSAHTRLEGAVQRFSGSIEEISDLDAENLTANEVLLDTHSPLDCTVNAVRGIFVKLYGSGSILYLNEPSDYKIIETQLGTGILRKK